MSADYHKKAKLILLLEIVLVPLIIIGYFWLKNLIVGIYFILFITILVSWLITLIISIYLFVKTKKEIDL